MSIAIPGEPPLVLDLGTGLRYFGLTCDPNERFTGTALLTHLHWDHTQGLPFFVPIMREGSTLDVYGPVQEDGRTLHDLFGDLIRPPQFPLAIDEYVGTVRFHDVESTDFTVGSIDVKVRPVPHIGPTVGYRITWRGVSVAYVPDHQQPYFDGVEAVTTDAVRELVSGVDLLIHDAQYTQADFARKPRWGHCTYQYAVALAASAGVKRLALYHHDPCRNDDQMDRIEHEAIDLAGSRGLEVFAARERLTVALTPES